MGILDDLLMEKVINDNGGSDIDLGNGNKESNEVRIIQTYCEIPKGKNTLLFALVKFGNYERYDIRSWYDNAAKLGKGMSLTFSELQNLYEAIRTRRLDCYDTKCRAKYDSDKVHASIYEQICLLSEYTSKGVTWNKVIQVIDWGYGPKYDFRKWTDNYSKCGKGISLSTAELEMIRNEISKLI